MAAPTQAFSETIRVLLLEDNPADAELCIRRLRKAGLNAVVDVARFSQEFMDRVHSQMYDIILTDYRLPDWNGLDAFRWLRSLGYDTPFVLVTGTLGDELAIECIKAGVSDYVLKENLERLSVAVRRTLEEQKLRQSRDYAERELRESEKQYRLLFNANPHPMWVFDPVTLRFLTVNEAAIQHYGYSLAEFLSMTMCDIRPEEELQKFLTMMRDPKHSGNADRQLWKHRKKDGTIIEVEISSQPITFRALNAELVLAHDVTVQRRAQAEVRESREQLQLLLDSTAEAICAIDNNGDCTLCNASCLQLLGYTDESDLLGKNMHQLLHHTHPDGRPYPLEECRIFRTFQRGEGCHASDEVLWRADGTCFPAEYWSYPISRDGLIVGSVVTFVDITERKRAEEQLRQSESRYRSIIEAAPYGVYRVDRNGIIAMVNSACVAMLGYRTAEELVGLNTAIDVYVNPIDQLRAADYAAGGPSVGFETTWKRKDGKLITVRLGGRRLPEDDELPGGYEVFVEDITEQRTLQNKFEQAQKMEAIGRMAGGMAHDFNNLLMVISGYAQLLEDPAIDPKKLTHYVAQIQSATSKAAAVTRQLLAFSRRQVLEPTILDLNYVVKDLGKMLPRLLGEDVEVVTVLDPHLGTLRADRGQIEQVIMNLAVNARDAMPDGGHLTIETSNVELEAARYQRHEIPVPPGRYVLLAVSDTGVGMDTETQHHIFEPFFTTKEIGKGTGLGLATVYGIVKQSQGFIWVGSEPGKGSIFKIYLPRLDVPATEQAAQPILETLSGFETILLAEDEIALRDVSRVYLESKGYIVLEAANAKEALSICENYEAPIHALITDVVMPGLGGLDLAKLILKMRPGLAVVLVSGYTDRAMDIESCGSGTKFLQKPYSLDTLGRTLRALLARVDK
jgi:two-component system, cell cycle sensor histidine kinase and response regulator CckA